MLHVEQQPLIQPVQRQSHAADVGAADVVELPSRSASPGFRVRRKILLTGYESRQRPFYESLGWADIRDVGVALAAARREPLVR